MAARGAVASAASSAAGNASASAGSVVTHQHTASSSCSAWAIRSAATRAGRAVASAMMRTSVGPGDHVDPHLPHHLALGLRHPAVTRAHDLVHPRHGGRPVGQRGHRLRPADPEDPRHARERAGREHHVGHPLRRHHGDDLLHPRHQRGHRVHDHRRGIGRLAAGDVEPDPVERRHLHADHAAVGLGEVEPGLPLVLVIRAHPVHGQGQGRPEPGAMRLSAPCQVAASSSHSRGAEVHPVELAGIFAYRLVAARRARPPGCGGPPPGSPDRCRRGGGAAGRAPRRAGRPARRIIRGPRGNTFASTRLKAYGTGSVPLDRSRPGRRRRPGARQRLLRGGRVRAGRRSAHAAGRDGPGGGSQS